MSYLDRPHKGKGIYRHKGEEDSTETSTGWNIQRKKETDPLETSSTHAHNQKSFCMLQLFQTIIWTVQSRALESNSTDL
jgi:hypothetical protein